MPNYATPPLNECAFFDVCVATYSSAFALMFFAVDMALAATNSPISDTLTLLVAL